LVDIFIESFQEPPDEIVLDYDATDDPTHGNQDRVQSHSVDVNC